MLNTGNATRQRGRMFIVNKFIAVVTFLGRHGTIAVALSVLIGLAWPGLAATFKPALGGAVIALLILSFLRVSPKAVVALARGPALVLAATAWLMLLLPVIFASLFTALGLAASLPDLYFILVLQSCAPAMMAAPAMAALIGVDAALTLACLLCSMAAAPVVAGAITHLFLGQSLISPLALGGKLFVLIAGSAVAAAAIRRVAGNGRIEARYQLLDGLSVIAMFIFAAAAMDGVTAYALAEPRLVAMLILVTFALALGTMLLTTIVFLAAGRDRAFAIGILTSNRNMGVILAATGFAVPPLAWLYFGLAQFPIYLLPMMLKWFARRLERPGD
jgi:predicted Na+-dependent transporter